MLLKITVICVATLQMVPFAHTKAHEIINNSPQLAEKRKDLPKTIFKLNHKNIQISIIAKDKLSGWGNLFVEMRNAHGLNDGGGANIKLLICSKKAFRFK